MQQHPGVTCPTCDSWKSPKKLYHSADRARSALNRKHMTRCNECGAEFSYVPRAVKSWNIFGLRKIIRKIVIQEMTVLKEGQL